MPFRFSHLCQLLESLEEIERHDPPLLRDARRDKVQKTVVAWFRVHRRTIEAPGTDRVALLSSLFPERRTDRVYLLQAPRLSQAIARGLELRSDKLATLDRFKSPGNGDLGDCLARVLKVHDAEPRLGYVSVEEVDAVLQDIASKKVTLKRLPGHLLAVIIRRLKSFEAKWLVRMILKDYAPVVLDQQHVLRCFHFLLPALLKFQDTFEAAMHLIKGPLAEFPSNPDPRSQVIFRKQAAGLLRPQIGVKVGRPSFHKAHSLKDCLRTVGSRKWAIERKYDGEYCEIHVDLAKGQDCIQIFSKSGKDSTQDRQGVHGSIREALRLGTSRCRFKRTCILLGELVVYCDKARQIQEFHKIRKHVSRSGSFLGTDADSQVHEHEHLMIVYFDVLMVDEDITMRQPHKERRDRLRDLIAKKRGRAMTAEWKVVDFAQVTAERTLVEQFACALYDRCEGLILKLSDAPYFPLDNTGEWRGFVKLKADYMIDMGNDRDVADFAVVGGSYDAQQALKTGLQNISWTTFHLGCLVNKEAVLRFQAKPSFRVVEVIHQEHCIPKPDLEALNRLGKLRQETDNLHREFDLCPVRYPIPPMGVVFRRPFVVEVLGSGYVKPPNQDFFMLRHPRVIKLHLDRDFIETTCIDELNSLAEKARNIPEDSESQETARLVKKILANRRERDERSSMRTTPQSTASTSPSSRRPTPGSHRAASTQLPAIWVDTTKAFNFNERVVEATRDAVSPGHTSAKQHERAFHPPPSLSSAGKINTKQCSTKEDQPPTNPRKRRADTAEDRHSALSTRKKMRKPGSNVDLPPPSPRTILRNSASRLMGLSLPPLAPLSDVTNKKDN
ncbi:hypothetical protein H2199_006332 [Coniosporium tulheliwenetii]|uniref:Uncharacterized protein n=1 Tax=Coniosporium tulheliwenetii TaxID=3383036 RepID=A0ACC2YXK4_9PEZI|nr:hypothetical protein H2199_006332 [Cladosporium sp. JES 115]